jgi:parallel beta helix pectate lyase-like protein
VNILLKPSACALSLLLSAQVAAAPRTFVASTGVDTNPCSLTAPCRALQAGVNAVDPGGELVVLDSAGYGPVTIAKAVQIVVPPGVYAGITVSSISGTGITISAGSSDVVTLRGLTIKGPGGLFQGSTAINFLAGGALHVEDCTISGFGSPAIAFNGPGELYVSRTVIRDNNGGGINLSAPAGPAATATVDHSWILNSGFGDGVLVGANSRLTVRESTLSGNSSRGLRAFGNTAGNAEATVENCTISGNGEGILSGSTFTDNATVRVSNSTITDNSSGVRFLGANTLLSGGGNTIQGNTIHGTMTGTYLKE